MARARRLLLFMFPTAANQHDRVIVGKLPGSDVVPENETGWDRLHALFTVNEYGTYPREFAHIIQSFTASGILGGLFGGVIGGRNAFINFLETNQATKFQNHLEAKRKLQREMTLAFARGFTKLSWRISIFCGTFVTTITLVNTYRDKDSLLEYVIAGCMAGTLYNWQVGPRGMIAGCAGGALVGTVGGSLILLTLKLFGTSMQEVRDFSSKLAEIRAEAIRKAELRNEERKSMGAKSWMDDKLYKDFKSELDTKSVEKESLKDLPK